MLVGFLRDLVAELADVVSYRLEIGDQVVELNGLIGRHLRLEHTGAKACTRCGRRANKLFDHGYCYPCFRSRPETDLCQMKPHECHYETCRDQAWGDEHCMIPTYVYLAKSSDVKVGISRSIPKRWMDQGAVEAVPIALLPTRKLAGELEYFLSRHMPDKTNWRKMLKGEVTETPLAEVQQRVLTLVPEEYRAYLLAESEAVGLTYPVTAVPEKITSHNLDKGAAGGKLLGIKGRYLILDTGVLNLANFVGYEVGLLVTEEASIAG